MPRGSAPGSAARLARRRRGEPLLTQLQVRRLDELLVELDPAGQAERLVDPERVAERLGGAFGVALRQFRFAENALRVGMFRTRVVVWRQFQRALGPLRGKRRLRSSQRDAGAEVDDRRLRAALAAQVLRAAEPFIGAREFPGREMQLR